MWGRRLEYLQSPFQLIPWPHVFYSHVFQICKLPLENQVSAHKGCYGNPVPCRRFRKWHVCCHGPPVDSLSLSLSLSRSLPPSTYTDIYIDRHAHICMYVGMYEKMHACLYYACMYVCMHVRMYVYIYLCMCAYLYVFMYLCIYVCEYEQYAE